MKRNPPRMDPATGEWEHIACPECGITPTLYDRVCRDCLQAMNNDHGEDL
ncbi:hypothetical protein L5G28_07700 [Gordonia sp. HY285]|nr:hypothetical protein [Gordonia liuliyuniae]MCF8610045.1 hypothetical protein [Gordonia liuliyuniae]